MRRKKSSVKRLACARQAAWQNLVAARRNLLRTYQQQDVALERALKQGKLLPRSKGEADSQK